jgi:hypothetical protein
MMLKSFKLWGNFSYEAASFPGQNEVTSQAPLETEGIKTNSAGGQDAQDAHGATQGKIQDEATEAKTTAEPSQKPANANPLLDDPELLDVVRMYVVLENFPNSDSASKSTSAEGSESSTSGGSETVSEGEGSAAVNGTLSDGMNKPENKLMLLMKQRNQEKAKRENAERRKAAKKIGREAESV